MDRGSENIRANNEESLKKNIMNQKYLKFVESVRNSDDSKDLKRYVEVNFIEQGRAKKKFDKYDSKMIQDILDKIDTDLGRSDMEKTTDIWVKFIKIKQGNEDVKEYVSDFERIECELRNVGIKIPSKALTIHLLNGSNLSKTSKENVISKADLSDDEKMYENIVKVVRELKSLSKTADNPSHTFFGNNS